MAALKWKHFWIITKYWRTVESPAPPLWRPGQSRCWRGPRQCRTYQFIAIWENKYGSVQKLRSTFGHLKSFKILDWIQFGLVGFCIVWMVFVLFVWSWFSLDKFGLVNLFWAWLRTIFFLVWIGLVWLNLVWLSLVWFGWLGLHWLSWFGWLWIPSCFYRVHGRTKKWKWKNKWSGI